MIKRNIYKNYRLILFLFIIFVLIGCKKGSQKPEIGKKDSLPKMPKVLTELEDKVLKIMYDLDSVAGIEKAIEEEKALEAKEAVSIVETPAEPFIQAQSKSKDEKKKKESTKGKKEEEKQQQNGGGGSSGQTEEPVDMQELIVENEIIIPLLEANGVKGTFAESATPPSDIDTVWSKINDNVTEIHKKWNVLEAQLPTEKVPSEKIEEFEKVLNDLTLSVVDKKRLNSLKLANKLTEITANFRSFFDDIGDHNVYKMYYHTRGVILSAASDNYTEAMDHLDETSKIGDSMRPDLIKKNSEDVLKKFELSVEDLEEQLTDKNFYLSQIKAPIVIKNIELIQDTFRTQK